MTTTATTTRTTTVTTSIIQGGAMKRARPDESLQDPFSYFSNILIKKLFPEIAINNENKNFRIDFKAKDISLCEFKFCGSAIILNFERNRNKSLTCDSLFWLPPKSDPHPFTAIPIYLRKELFQRGNELIGNIPSDICSDYCYLPIIYRDADSFLRISRKELTLSLYSYDPISKSQKTYSISCTEELRNELLQIELDVELHVVSHGLFIFDYANCCFCYFKTGHRGLPFQESIWINMPDHSAYSPSDNWHFGETGIYNVHQPFDEERKKYQTSISFCEYENSNFVEMANFAEEGDYATNFRFIRHYFCFLANSESVAYLTLYDTNTKEIQRFDILSHENKSSSDLRIIQFSAAANYFVISCGHLVHTGLPASETHTFILKVSPQIELIPLQIGIGFHRGYLYSAEQIPSSSETYVKIESIWSARIDAGQRASTAAVSASLMGDEEEKG